MFIYLIIGVLLATVGITILNCIGEVIIATTELIKAFVGVGIMKCNTKIDKLQNSQEESTRAIGFNTTFEEDEEDDQ